MTNNRIIKALKTVDYKLLIMIFAMMSLPTIYQTIRVFFLGNMPNDWGFNIASQLSWVNVCYEVVQEALMLPLFFLLGKSLNNKSDFENKVRSGLLIIAVIYLLCSIFLIVFTKRLVVFMAQNSNLIDATVDYIRLESIAALFSILWRFVMLTLVMLGENKAMFILLILQTSLSILLDTFFLSNFQISAQIGVNGIAITNIIVNVIILFISISLLKRQNITIFKNGNLSFVWVKEWVAIGKYSAIESFIRNSVFALMIIRMVNLISEQSTYWIANNFIWQWLLLPGLALAELVKKEIGEDLDNIRKKTLGYTVLVLIFSVIWLLTIPVWKPFLYHIMNVTNYEEVFNIVLMQSGFYILFLFNNCILDSTLYGAGKTNYMLAQSFCINIFYYGGLFILYMNGLFVPTLLSISLMFGIGMALDFIPTVILYKRFLRKTGVRIDYYESKKSKRT